ncbi:hypothetical protein QFZ50_002894 [Arthrobacter agilis]|nr:hypothetical protein [Arthrobacter agilis]
MTVEDAGYSEDALQAGQGRAGQGRAGQGRAGQEDAMPGRGYTESRITRDVGILVACSVGTPSMRFTRISAIFLPSSTIG